MDLIIDSFAGGGGASTGIEMALGRSPDIAINHDPRALAMHAANHPGTMHVCKSIWDVDPRDLVDGNTVGLAWFSPDCTHFSIARGGKPRKKEIRDLANVVIDYARKVKPRVIMLENVKEFRDWGPLDDDNKPIKSKKGNDFRRWLGELAACGYRYEHRLLRACDYGAPTIRQRFFLVARCDDESIVWPEPTHADPKLNTGLAPWRTAAEIIDWAIPCPSIFERKKPLAENTLKRIYRGIQKFVIDDPEPFVLTYYGPKANGEFRGCSMDEPIPTQTTENRHAIVAAHISKFRTGSTGHSMTEPLHTITSGGKSIRPAGSPHAMGVVAAHVSKYYGQGTGHRADSPIACLTAMNKQALISANIVKNYTGVVGTRADVPLGTITAKDHHSLATSFLTKMYGTCRHGQDMCKPFPTVTASGQHVGEVRAFLTKYYTRCQHGQSMNDPMHTLTTKARLGLVTIQGEQYRINDIGLRMLQPRELFTAQGFSPDYIIDLECNGRKLSKADQVSMCGNSVPPQLSAALVRANCAELAIAA